MTHGSCFFLKNNECPSRFLTFFWFGGTLGSASRAKFPVSLSNHVGFTLRLLYSCTHHSPESFTHLKTGWAEDAWLQWSYENWYFHLDISRWQISDFISEVLTVRFSFNPPLCLVLMFFSYLHRMEISSGVLILRLRTSLWRCARLVLLTWLSWVSRDPILEHAIYFFTCQSNCNRSWISFPSRGSE